jgi:histidine triad (HIT) family protein
MTVFAKIIRGELPCKKAYESENILAIYDIAPIAPVHILIMPKKAYESFQKIPEEDLHILAEIGACIQMLAEQHHISQGYRLLTNTGHEAGQTVFHLHFHLIGGRPLLGMG